MNQSNLEQNKTLIVKLNVKLQSSDLSLCDYRDAYILVSGTITITGAGADAAARWLDERSKEVVFKSCAQLT